MVLVHSPTREVLAEARPSIYKSSSLDIWITSAPIKAEIVLLEPFIGCTLEHTHLPTSGKKFASATAGIKAANVADFDTESKPTFVTGDVSEGTHVVQFALHDKACAALKVFEVLDLFREDLPIKNNPT